MYRFVSCKIIFLIPGMGQVKARSKTRLKSDTTTTYVCACMCVSRGPVCGMVPCVAWASQGWLTLLRHTRTHSCSWHLSRHLSWSPRPVCWPWSPTKTRGNTLVDTAVAERPPLCEIAETGLLCICKLRFVNKMRLFLSESWQIPFADVI